MMWVRRGAVAILLAITGWAVLLWFGIAYSGPPQDRMVNLPRFNESIHLSFVGTSLTASYDWPFHLTRCGQGISVSRFAQGGATSNWGLSQIEEITARHPDVVFIEFSINDADVRRGVSLQQSAENHRHLIGSLRADLPSAQIVLMTMSPAYGTRRLLRPWLPAYYRLYRRLAAELGTGLVDLFPRWQALEKSDRGQKGGLHPAAVAADRVILTALREYLGIVC